MSYLNDPKYIIIDQALHALYVKRTALNTQESAFTEFQRGITQVPGEPPIIGTPSESYSKVCVKLMRVNNKIAKLETDQTICIDYINTEIEYKKLEAMVDLTYVKMQEAKQLYELCQKNYNTKCSERESLKNKYESLN